MTNQCFIDILRRAIASKPFGWPVFELGDMYPGRRIGDTAIPSSGRTRRRRFREWMEDSNRHFTAADSLSWAAGSTWTWSDSAGSPSFNMTLNGLGSTNARQGVKSTTTIVAPPNGGTNAVPPDYFAFQLTAAFATGTPTTGAESQVYASWSSSGTPGTDNPGGAAITGTDAALTALTILPLLQFCGSLITAADITASASHIQTPFAVVNSDPAHRPYLCPVVYNNTTAQAYVASNNASTLSVIPYWRQRAI